MNNRFSELMRGRTVGFFGIGKSTVSLLKMLSGTGISAVLRSDKKIRRDILPEGLTVRAVFEENEAARDIFEDVLIFSPSVRRDRREFLAAAARGCRLTSDFEIFLELCEKPIFLVTGSDGKSSTATLASKMLGEDFPAVGNIGVPLVASLNENARGYVVEASSFMLEYARPRARRCVLTSLSEDHIDWHGNFEEYKAAKMGAVKDALEAVISADSAAALDAFSGKEIYAVCSKNFSEYQLKKRFSARVFYSVCKGFILRNGERIFDLSEAYRREDFNVKNYINALALTEGFCDGERALDAIRNFRGLPHRCEIFAEIRGVKFINSSIDTSPERTASTLKNLPRGLIILLGGRDKKLDFAPLTELICARGDRVIIYGEAREKIASAFGNYPYIRAENLREAASLALKNARAGDTVLLSPAAASYDEFSSFEERGDCFKNLILAYI